MITQATLFKINYREAKEEAKKSVGDYCHCVSKSDSGLDWNGNRGSERLDSAFILRQSLNKLLMEYI